VTVLDPELIASIRTLIGVSEAVLPDAVLADPLLSGAAEQQVHLQIGEPGYPQRPPAEQAIIRTAVAYRTAAAALETGPVREALSTQSEQFSQQYTVRRTAPDISGWAARLRLQADDALAPLLAHASGATMFSLASGRRGR
jgi:hypothetical protein